MVIFDISEEEKRQFCLDKGAVGVINRKDFDHWGPMPDTNAPEWGTWMKGARAFGKAIWEAVGEKKNPRIVFEHPGATTFPTSVFVCERFGRVVICAGTSGYDCMFDVRYLWMLQKDIIGSHFANALECVRANELVHQGLISPVVSEVFNYDEIPKAHQLMYENKHSGKINDWHNICLLYTSPSPRD